MNGVIPILRRCGLGLGCLGIGTKSKDHKTRGDVTTNDSVRFRMLLIYRMIRVFLYIIITTLPKSMIFAKINGWKMIRFVWDGYYLYLFVEGNW